MHADRFPDPGVPEHKPRLTDTDARAAKRAERTVTTLFVLSALGTIGSLVAYFALRPDGTVPGVRLSTLALGVTLALSLLGIGFAAVHWAKSLMSTKDYIDDRHPIATSQEDRDVAVLALKQGVEDSGIGRRGLLKGAMVGALLLFPATIAVPLISSVGGDWNVSAFRHTLWERGRRLAYDPDGRLVKAADLTIGSVAHVQPEASEEELAVRELGAVSDRQAVVGQGQPDGRRMRAHLDAPLGVPVLAEREEGVTLGRAAQVLLRERRPLVRPVRLAGHDDEIAVVPLLAQRPDGTRGSETATDDDDGVPWHVLDPAGNPWDSQYHSATSGRDGPGRGGCGTLSAGSNHCESLRGWSGTGWQGWRR